MPGEMEDVVGKVLGDSVRFEFVSDLARLGLVSHVSSRFGLWGGSVGRGRTSSPTEFGYHWLGPLSCGGNQRGAQLQDSTQESRPWWHLNVVVLGWISVHLPRLGWFCAI